MLLLVGGLPMAALPHRPPPGKPDSPILQDFAKRIAGYLASINPPDLEVPDSSPTDSAGSIFRIMSMNSRHRIREAQARRWQGAIFTPEISSEFRRLIRITMQGPTGRRLSEVWIMRSRSTCRPYRSIGAYPEGASTAVHAAIVPFNLPQLPPELEYRVVDPRPGSP